MAETFEIGLKASNTSYIKHPAVGASDSYGKDGKVLDAGLAHILQNNLNVLHRESGRHLVTWLGPGNVSQASDNGWSGLNEDVPPSSQRTTTETEIAWNIFGTPTACMDGPFFPTRGRIDATSTYGAGVSLFPRVRFHVEAYSDGANTLKLYAAATTTPTPPSSGYIALATTTTTSATLVHLTLTLNLSGTGRRSWPSSADGAADCDEIYLWLGWRNNSGATMGWLSASAYERLDTTDA